MAAGGRATAAAAAVPAAGAAAADEVVRCVRPTEASERCRAEVVDYVRRLVGSALGCEVFAYGSVPLKTYLPDGDIDLTIIGNASHDSTLVNDVYCVLESEDQNSDAGFEVKDLARIDAEVRLIKCTIENIIVDISFNQTGGICALCFLELVDRKVGKDHLFKRSIILIKAWCYYESRLLGAHHGLISTYALEILILYIFNIFHKSLHCPLEVLYRFLEYFSKFDWDNYCISLNGPVALSSLPNLTVESTITHTDDLLFDKEFLKSSVDEAAVLPRNSNGCYSIFRPKYLNIIDPLKEHNNLGRSVHRASFHRIRTAFSYGARKLGEVLLLPSEVIPDEIFRFFKNTLGRNGRGVRPDISSVALDPSFTTGKLLEDISTMTISYKKEDEDRTNYHLSKSLDNDDSCVGMDRPTHLSSCFSGFCSSALSTDLCTVSSHFAGHAPTQYSSFYLDNGYDGSEKCYLDYDCADKAFNVDARPSMQSEIHVNSPSFTLNSSAVLNNSELATDMKNWSADHVGQQHLPPSLLSLPDLAGDLDSQFSCLRQVQYHLEYLFDRFLQSVKASPAEEFHKERFHVPTIMDSVSPRLLLPSSCKRNGRTPSPISCYLRTKDVSQDSQSENLWNVAYQQNILLPYVTDIPDSQNEYSWDVAYQQDISLPGRDVPATGLSPSSYVDSDMSSVLRCYSPGDNVEMHRADTYCPRKINDTHVEQLASPRENGKTMTNQVVIIGTRQASSPRGSFIPHKDLVELDSRTKEIIGQPLKVLGCVPSDRKNVEKLSFDAEKKFVRHGDEARQIPKCSQDVYSKNFWQKRCDGTDMESTRTPIVTNHHIPRYQPSNVQSTTKECARGLRTNWLRKQSCGTKKDQEMLNWPTKQIPICEPLKLQNRRGNDCSKKISAGKQNYNNPNEHLSFVRGAEQMPCRDANLNGLEREVNSNEPIENENHRSPLLPEMPLSFHSIDGQEKSSVANTSQSSFPVANGRPVESIEFGSLGPFALTSSSLKLNRDMDKITTSKVFTHASTPVLQRSRAGTSENRSPGFCRVGDEDEFPPLSAGIR